MLTSRNSIFAIFLLSVAALAAAFTAQYGFGLRPCELCLFQRVPYAVAIFLSALALALRVEAKMLRIVLGLCALAFFADAGLALYHVGVEQHWWAGPTACTGGGGTVGSVEDLAAMLAKPIDIPQCDRPAWLLFGISMAGYNLLACLVLAGFSVLSARKIGQTP